MRLFGLELKRILKSRRTRILLASIILLSVAMAYLPISFESINRPNEDGTVTELEGLAAIKYKSDLYTATSGEVTPEKVKKALETYQNCVKEYGPVEDENFPLAVKVEEILPIRPLLKGLSEVFVDPLTGIGMQNNFLYQLVNFNYLHIGEMSFWTPYVILTSAVIEIPVFLLLTIKSYCNHQVK